MKTTYNGPYISLGDRELQKAYEQASDAYHAAAEHMLDVASDAGSDATAFVAASRAMDQIWSTLCDIRGLLLLRGVSARTIPNGGLTLHERTVAAFNQAA